MWPVTIGRGSNQLLGHDVIQEEVKIRGWPVATSWNPNRSSSCDTGGSLDLPRSRASGRAPQRSVMRKGGGGLVVIAPDGSAIADAVSLYLEYRNLDTSALVETRRARNRTARSSTS